MNDLDRCILFATMKHSLQTYYGHGTFKDEPYICHCLRVMLRLSQKPNRYDLMIVGILHDVLEDTDTTIEEIARETGIDDILLNALEDITKKPGEEYGEYIDRLCNASLTARLVKIEDLFENLSRNPPEDLSLRYRKAILKLSPALAEQMEL